MRKLPIFFVLDVSESMIGEPLRKMEAGIDQIIASLRQDPHSLETVFISLIAFAGKAKALTPLIDLISFYPPKIPIGGGTALGTALNVLMDEIDTKVLSTTFEQRGDWEPIVFLITDGKPTDNPQNAVSRWQKHYAARASMIAITLGSDADMKVLGQLTENVLSLENTEENEFSKFIEWISASVKAQSQKIEMEGSNEGISLEKATSAGLTVISDVYNYVMTDPNYVVLTGKCATTFEPYLIKYTKVKTAGLEQYIKQDYFGLEGVFALDDSYFDWSSEQDSEESINTSVLDGVPSCPHCHNSSAFAVCECGKLLCLGSSGFANCPWCSKDLKFNMTDGGEDFSVGRGQG
jgi:uncharacterized protein YegL